MKLSEFIIEIIIFVIGGIISILSLFSEGDCKQLFAVLVIIITLSTDIIIITIKFVVKAITGSAVEQFNKMLGSVLTASLGYMLQGDKINERWKEKTNSILDVFSVKIHGLIEGCLDLNYEELFNYQNDLIKNTKRKLDAIHVANSIDSLKLWDPERREISRFQAATYYACKELKTNVEKRRLFLLKKEFEKNEQDVIKRVIIDQVKNLKFDVKKIYIEDILGKIIMPNDLIISDEEEVIEIIMRFDKVESARDYVNQETVKKMKESFEKLWNSADTFDFLEESNEKNRVSKEVNERETNHNDRKGAQNINYKGGEEQETNDRKGVQVSNNSEGKDIQELNDDNK